MENNNSFESMGAHIRNVLSEYSNIVQILTDLHSKSISKDKKEFLKKYILEYIKPEDLNKNLQHLIELSKNKDIEKINWRDTELYKNIND